MKAKARFNLQDFGIPTNQKVIIWNDIKLSTSILESILNVITIKYIFNKKYKMIDGKKSKYIEEGVHIPITNFVSICPQAYKYYLGYLVEKGIILINNTYQVGVSSRTYYFTNKFKKYAKLIEVRKENKDIVKEETDPLCIIDKDIQDRLYIDYYKLNVFDEYVEKSYYMNDDGEEIYDFKTYLRHMFHLLAIKNKNGFFNIQNSRLYTDFTYCDSNIRKNNLIIDDERIIEFDIPSSFPLFLSLWFLENGIDKNNYELKEFVEGLKTKQFYHMIKDKLNKIKDISRKESDLEKEPYTKNQAKELFQCWLNGCNVNQDGTIKNDDINTIMKIYYPELNEIFLKKKAEVKNTFYMILERMESNYIFNIVCKRLYIEIPDIRIISCHDAIYVGEKYKDDVSKIWKEELDKLYSNFIFDNNIEYNYNELGIIDEFNEYKKKKEIKKYKPATDEEIDDFFNNKSYSELKNEMKDFIFLKK